MIAGIRALLEVEGWPDAVCDAPSLPMQAANPFPRLFGGENRGPALRFIPLSSRPERRGWGHPCILKLIFLCATEHEASLNQF